MGSGGSKVHPDWVWCNYFLVAQQNYCKFEYPYKQADASRNQTNVIANETAVAENNTKMNLLKQRETQRLLDREKNNNIMATEYMVLLRKKLEALREEEEIRRRLNANSPWTFNIDQTVESSVDRSKIEDVFINLMLDQHGLDAFYLRQPNEPNASSEEKMRLIRQNVYFDTGSLLEPYMSKQKLFVGNYPTGLAAIGQHPWIDNQWKYFTHDQTLFKVKRLN